mgnify:CR=1 FL=1
MYSRISTSILRQVRSMKEALSEYIVQRARRKTKRLLSQSDAGVPETSEICTPTKQRGIGDIQGRQNKVQNACTG